MGNLNPRTSPPALPPESMGSVGYVHGLQSSEKWTGGASDSRQICDQKLSNHIWRVSVFASTWVRLDIVYGTARTINIKALNPPLVLYVPGQCVVYAQPVLNNVGAIVDGFAYCTATPVNSAGAPQIRKLVSGAQVFDDHVVKFFAFDASVVQFPGGVTVTLAAGQSTPLVAGSSLVSGDGFVEYEL